MMMIANGNTTFIITFCKPYFYIDIFSCFISLNSTCSIFRFQFIRSFTRLCCDCICICHCQRVYDRACLSASYSVLDSKRVMEFENEKFEREKLFGIEFVGLRTYNVEKKEIYSEKSIGMKQKSLKKTKITRKNKNKMKKKDWNKAIIIILKA